MAALLFPSVAWDPALLLDGQVMGEASQARFTDFRQQAPPQPLSDDEAAAFLRGHARTLSLYSIDAVQRRVVLTLLPDDASVDLRKAAFMYQSQRRHATALLTLSFEVSTGLCMFMASKSDSLVHRV